MTDFSNRVSAAQEAGFCQPEEGVMARISISLDDGLITGVELPHGAVVAFAPAVTDVSFSRNGDDLVLTPTTGAATVFAEYFATSSYGRLFGMLLPDGTKVAVTELLIAREVSRNRNCGNVVLLVPDERQEHTGGNGQTALATSRTGIDERSVASGGLALSACAANTVHGDNTLVPEVWAGSLKYMKPEGETSGSGDKAERLEDMPAGRGGKAADDMLVLEIVADGATQDLAAETNDSADGSVPAHEQTGHDEATRIAFFGWM